MSLAKQNAQPLIDNVTKLEAELYLSGEAYMLLEKGRIEESLGFISGWPNSDKFTCVTFRARAHDRMI
jgi:hypothetical protein